MLKPGIYSRDLETGQMDKMEGQHSRMKRIVFVLADGGSQIEICALPGLGQIEVREITGRGLAIRPTSGNTITIRGEA